MNKAKLIAIAFTFSITVTSPAVAQRYNNESACHAVVSGLCAASWEDSGYYSYQNCYESNMWNCEAQEGGEGTYDQILLPGPRCVSGSGGWMC